MKKILAMLLALCMVLALVACKTPDTAEPTKAPEVTDAPATEPEATAEPTQEPEAVLAEQKSLAGYEYVFHCVVTVMAVQHYAVAGVSTI